MSIRGNLVYSALLTMSTYLVPLLVFPYISRVLGADGIGIVDTVDNIIDYCVLFSMMGLSTIGIREIARAKSDAKQLAQTFTDLYALNVISTIVIALILICATLVIPNMNDRWPMILIGSVKLFANMFWIEWFFTGIEDFRFITVRSIIVRTLFVISVFLFVNTKDDYMVYYMLFVGITVLNAICNWHYRARLFSINLCTANFRRFLKPFLALGLFAMLSAIYTKLSLPVLNYYCGDLESGYYATAMRIYQVCIALVSTLIGVLVPRISVLLKEGDIQQIKKLTRKTFMALIAFSLPIILVIFFFGNVIVCIIAGDGYQGAVLPMQIIALLLLIGGVEKIVILQLLIPMRADRQIVIAGFLGVIVWGLGTWILVEKYQSVGSAIIWVISETTVLMSASISLYKIFRNEISHRNSNI